MLKHKRVLLIVISLILIITTNVFAVESKTELQVVQKASETKYLENDQGFVSKTIVDSNVQTGEVTIELKLSNTKKETTSESRYDNNEIFIIIPEDVENEKLTYVETLAQKVLEKSSNSKIGIIGLKGPICDTYFDDGKMHENEGDEGGVNGTESNAEVVAQLTNDISMLKSNLRSMNAEKKTYYYNLQAALRLANNSYSTNTNKILICLYDNVPFTAIGMSSNTYSFGGLFSQYNTAEESARAHISDLVSKTKSEIIALKKSNIDFILLRPDDTRFDRTYYNIATGEFLCKIDGAPYANELYGTLENPTYGKMYSLNNDNLEKIVTENIYNDIIEKIHSDILNIKIVDYFPENVINNFDFSYVEKPNVGTVSDEIDLETKTISWDIGTLKGNETATLKYKLKLKDMNNEELLDKVISTNEKVVLTYTDTEEKSYEVILDSSPKLKLQNIEIEDDDTNTAPENNDKDNKDNNSNIDIDNTISKDKLPNTGKIIGVWGVGITAIIGTVAYIKYKKLKGVK